MDLPIFRCRSCTRRLRYPIMEIADFGNVCGICFQKTPYTDAAQNEELCLQMKKLYFSCYYVEDGCTFYGSFTKTFKHERMCRFKVIRCPFAYQNKCDKQLQLLDIPKHISEDHTDSVLSVEDGSIIVENPSDSNPHRFDAFKIDENYFLMRSLLDKEAQRILYTFYRLTDGYSAENIRFYSMGFNSFDERGLVLPGFKLTDKFDRKHAFIANISALDSLESVQKLKINFRNETDAIINILSNKVWWQCRKCLKTSATTSFCSNCRRPIPECADCKGRCCTYTKYAWSPFADPQIGFVFACDSTGCNQFVRGDKYLIHRNYLCRFKTHQCVICDGNYTVADMRAHMEDAHTDLVNPQVCFVSVDQPIKHVFINDVDVFVAECFLAADTQKLAVTIVKVTEPNWDDNFIWKVLIRKEGSKSESFTKTSDCTMDGSFKEMEVSDYIVDNGLDFVLYIARI